ncbi:MAG: hypothetical protein AAF525_12295 [Pseudomonadota bacterium]
MNDSMRRFQWFPAIGTFSLVVGLSVFAIRLTHAGPYAMPQGGAFVGGLAALLLGGLLIWSSKPNWMNWGLLILLPVAWSPAIYSIMGESEEVISLYAFDHDNNRVDLRLWIVDRDDGSWVGMGRGKAISHSLDGAQLEVLRFGDIQCVTPTLYEDRATVSIIHQMKVEKYKVAQIAGALGMYPLEATDSMVALRLDPCSKVSDTEVRTPDT